MNTINIEDLWTNGIDRRFINYTFYSGGSLNKMIQIKVKIQSLREDPRTFFLKISWQISLLCIVIHRIISNDDFNCTFFSARIIG